MMTPVLVFAETAGGLTGIGMTAGGRAVAFILEDHLTRFLIGQPASEIHRLVEDLFGACHAGVQPVEEADGSARWTPEARGFGKLRPPTVLAGVGSLKGLHLRASFYLHTLVPTSGAPILRAGDKVAGVLNTRGAGQAILVGTFAGLCATAHTHPGKEAATERVDVRGFRAVRDLLEGDATIAADQTITVTVPATNLSCPVLSR